jgi:hypothetical protein
VSSAFLFWANILLQTQLMVFRDAKTGMRKKCLKKRALLRILLLSIGLGEVE